MDALLSAYSSSSEGEDGDGSTRSNEAESEKRRKRTELTLIDPVSAFTSTPHQYVPSQSVGLCPRAEAKSTASVLASLQSAGRYVSKRERAAAALASSISLPVHPSNVLESILNVELPRKLQQQVNAVRVGAARNRLPKGLLTRLEGHTKGVNTIRWSPSHGALLASAAMDHMAYIWNVWNVSGRQLVRKLSHHSAAVKDIQWSLNGMSVLTCGFDKKTWLIDVESGGEIKVFTDDQFINVVRFHPFQDGVFLSGGSNGSLKLWDIRSGKSVKEYSKSHGQIMDMDFSRDGNHFVSTSDIAKRNASDKSIVVWDFNTQVPLSNQVYVEAYTCPCVRYHPHEESFVAQSNANYIAIFSARPPFKLNKFKRYEGHQVSAYRVQCNFSPDGGVIVTGSSDGRIYFYNYGTSRILKTIEAHENVCMDVCYHPFLPSVIASCSWDGFICVYE